MKLFKKICPLCDQKESLDWEIRLFSEEGQTTLKICKSCADALDVINKNVHKCFICGENEAIHDVLNKGICDRCHTEGRLFSKYYGQGKDPV